MPLLSGIFFCVRSLGANQPDLNRPERHHERCWVGRLRVRGGTPACPSSRRQSVRSKGCLSTLCAERCRVPFLTVRLPFRDERLTFRVSVPRPPRSEAMFPETLAVSWKLSFEYPTSWHPAGLWRTRTVEPTKVIVPESDLPVCLSASVTGPFFHASPTPAGPWRLGGAYSRASAEWASCNASPALARASRWALSPGSPDPMVSTDTWVAPAARHR
jgi:hypothetical protein